MDKIEQAKVNLFSVKRLAISKEEELNRQAKWIYEKYKCLELLNPKLWCGVSVASKNVVAHIFQQVEKGNYEMALKQAERLRNYILLGSLDIGKENKVYQDVFLQYQEELADFDTVNPVLIVEKLEELILNLKQLEI